jgi:hypothetical protein
MYGHSGEYYLGSVNPTALGHTPRPWVQLGTGKNEPGNWIVLEDNHPAIIDRKTL